MAAACISWAAGCSRSRDWSHDLPLQRRTRYFVVHYQRPTWDAAGFARVADAFVDLVDREFVPARLERPLDVLVFADRATFHRYLAAAGVPFRPKGIYLPALGVLATAEDTGLGTLTHEIMHPIVQRALPDCPAWAFEGIPAFFEKFLGYWDGDRLVVQWGYQNPWRLEQLGPDLARPDLPRIVAEPVSDAPAATSEQRLVAVFLWQQGRFERFLRLVAARDRRGFGTYLEAAMERPLDDIVPLWRAYLAELSRNREAALRVPPSTVYPDRAAFEQALGTSRAWLQARMGR